MKSWSPYINDKWEPIHQRTAPHDHRYIRGRKTNLHCHVVKRNGYRTTSTAAHSFFVLSFVWVLFLVTLYFTGQSVLHFCTMFMIMVLFSVVVFPEWTHASVQARWWTADRTAQVMQEMNFCVFTVYTHTAASGTSKWPVNSNSNVHNNCIMWTWWFHGNESFQKHSTMMWAMRGYNGNELYIND